MKMNIHKKRDEIINWLINNSQTFLTEIGFSLEELEEDFKILNQTYAVNRQSRAIGEIDVQFRIESDDFFSEKLLTIVNVIVNVEMKSAADQLRKLKDIRFQQYDENVKTMNIKQIYVIVSTNDEFKDFFIDNDFIFYKF